MPDMSGETRCPTCGNWAFQDGFSGSIICHHCRPEPENPFLKDKPKPELETVEVSLPESELKAMEEKGEAICKMAGMHSFDQTPNGKLVAEVRRLRKQIEDMEKAAEPVQAHSPTPTTMDKERMTKALKELVSCVRGGREVYLGGMGKCYQVNVSADWLKTAEEFLKELQG